MTETAAPRAIPRPFISGSKAEKVLLVVATAVIAFDVFMWSSIFAG